MIKWLLALFLLLPTIAFAETQRNPCYYAPTNVPGSGPGGSGCVPVGTNAPMPVTTGGSGAGSGDQPYNYTPLTPGQFNLGIVASTALTIPTGALQAVVCVSGANANYTYDGTTTPTNSVGMPLLQNQCIQFSGAVELANIRFIQQSATATLNVSYTK